MKAAYRAKSAQDFIGRYSELSEELALRIYTSRLLGSEASLVLHGGGNTSVKVRSRDLLGAEQEILYIKGSGTDLATIEADGFVGMDLAYLRKLRGLEALSEEAMENELLTHRLRADARSPSVETLLHAFLPHRFIDHTHADAILIFTNRVRHEEQVRKVLGERVAVLPYLMPGLPLAKQVADCYDENPQLEAIISLEHGIFTFGDAAEVSYSRMIETVSRAEAHIEQSSQHSGFQGSAARSEGAMLVEEAAPEAARVMQALRGVCSHTDEGGRRTRFVAELRGGVELQAIAASETARELCRSGVLTPDHVIRTKNEILYLDNVPESDETLRELVSAEVSAYCERYDAYFESQTAARGVDRVELDPYPRLALVHGVGLVAIGPSRAAARIAADIGEHTLHAKRVMHELGGHQPIGRDHVYEMEYWTLQQKKLRAADSVHLPPLQGQVALVTGAGGAIGAGIAERLLAAGAVVAISDIDQQRLQNVSEILAEQHDRERIELVACDVTDIESTRKALAEVSCRAGGIDILVPNAGIAHVATIEELDPAKFEQVLSVNLMGVFNSIKAVAPIFRRQASGGNVVLISSKNVPDPGAAFGAYSASKAGAHQIAKIAALEMADMGVRVNMVNPDAVFGDERVSSGLWDLIGPDRMKSRGLDPAGLRNYYRERNLLKAAVRAEHVGNIVVFFASELTPTTGASFPVDGGVPSAFPR